MFPGCRDHSHWPFPAFLGTELEAAGISGLTTQQRWWEQQAVGRESPEHLKTSELWLDLAESRALPVPGAAGRDGPVLLRHL